jgi:RimJ/RimL family protein N-acetyltransferase
MLASFRGISLRPVFEDDQPFLFRLLADPSRCHLWMRGQPAYDEAGFRQTWVAWTAGMITAKFLVESAGRPVGLVFDYDRMPQDGCTKVTALLDEESTGSGRGAIATVLFWDWLFQSAPFRKVYLDVFGYNPTVVRMLRKIGLVEEGVLKGDRYWNGAYWDLHVFALYREAFPRVRDRVLRTPGAGQARAPAGPALSGEGAGRADRRVPSNGCLSGAE